MPHPGTSLTGGIDVVDQVVVDHDVRVADEDPGTVIDIEHDVVDLVEFDDQALFLVASLLGLCCCGPVPRVDPECEMSWIRLWAIVPPPSSMLMPTALDKPARSDECDCR